jgi:hypothetical protein
MAKKEEETVRLIDSLKAKINKNVSGVHSEILSKSDIAKIEH